MRKAELLFYFVHTCSIAWQPTSKLPFGNVEFAPFFWGGGACILFYKNWTGSKAKIIAVQICEFFVAGILQHGEDALPWSSKFNSVAWHVFQMFHAVECNRYLRGCCLPVGKSRSESYNHAGYRSPHKENRECKIVNQKQRTDPYRT